jgi:NAD(P)-dependent dehydrogenase (short-subunit alcohol dehydrogenase family)
MDLRLSGMTAIVTGASRGIGLAIARELTSEGVQVVAAARETTSELRTLADHGELVPVISDLTAPDGPRAVVETAASAWGRLDILVNNVGAVRPRTGGFRTVADEEWTATLAVNFLAAVRVTRLALPLMERGSSIVTISSVNAALPDPLVIDYSAAKGALTNFCKALSKEVGPRGIRVNTVSPGPVATDLWLGTGGVAQTLAGVAGSTPESVAADAVAATPTGRFTEPSEVADLVLFLASPRAGNITGADFAIDGGLKATL